MKSAKKISRSSALPKTPLEIKVERDLLSLKAFGKEVTASKQASRNFLKEIGLVDEHGRLTKHYR